jgi:hypothetical protein
MKNDEIRMVRAGLALNDERMSKHEIRKDFAATNGHLFIRDSFELRHSSFVIVTI